VYLLDTRIRVLIPIEVVVTGERIFGIEDLVQHDLLVVSARALHEATLLSASKVCLEGAGRGVQLQRVCELPEALGCHMPPVSLDAQ